MPKLRAAERHDDYDDAPMVGTRQMESRTVLRETRDAEARPDADYSEPPSDYVWRRPTALDAPPPRPGMVQRWVSMTIRNEKNTVNWSNKYREGWQIRDAASLPDEWRHLRGATEGQGSAITIGGLTLCEIPEYKLKAKRAAINEAIRNQERSVSAETDTVSREGARYGAPPVVRDERITIERGRRPSTALAD